MGTSKNKGRHNKKGINYKSGLKRKDNCVSKQISIGAIQNKENNLFNVLKRNKATLNKSLTKQFFSIQHSQQLFDTVQLQDNALVGIGSVAVKMALKRNLGTTELTKLNNEIKNRNWKQVYFIVGNPNTEKVNYISKIKYTAPTKREDGSYSYDEKWLNKIALEKAKSCVLISK